MVSVRASCVADNRFKPWLWQIEEIGIFCFSAMLAILRSKSKDWLAQNQDNVRLSSGPKIPKKSDFFFSFAKIP